MVSRIFTIIPQAKNEDLSSASSSKTNLSALGQIPSSGLARPPSHLPHLTHRPQVYLKRWMAGKAVRVSESCRQFISLRHFLSSCHKGTSFEATRDRKYHTEPERAQGCFSITNKRKLCTERSPTLSSATLLPGDRGAGSWCVNKCSLVSTEGRDQVPGSTHQVAGKALLYLIAFAVFPQTDIHDALQVIQDLS